MVSGIGNNGAYDLSALSARIFKQFDADSSGGIDKNELQRHTENSTADDIEAVFNMLDYNADGTIDKSEIEDALHELTNEVQKYFTTGKMERMAPPKPEFFFTDADTDGDGGISLSEFSAMDPNGQDETTVEKMFAALDADGNGTIDETEQTAAMEKMPPPPPPQGQPPENLSQQMDTPTSLNGNAAAGSSATNVAEKSSAIQQLLDIFQSSTTDDHEDSEASQFIRLFAEKLHNGLQYSQQGTRQVNAGDTASLFSILT